MTANRNDTGHVAPLLIIEDNDEDYETITWALRRRGMTRPVTRAVDGDDALDALYRRGAYAAEPMPQPALILLDLNLSTVDGRGLLEQIKRDPALRSIPVIVWTASASAEDVRRCYARGANSYIVKPSGGESYLSAIELLDQYWLGVVRLPSDVEAEDGEQEAQTTQQG